MKFKFNKMFILMVLSMFVVNISFANELDSMLDSMNFQNQQVNENDISTQVPVGKTITLADADNYVKDKGVQLVLFIQSIAKPITLVVMVLCGLMAIITGLIGSRDGGSSKWFFAGLISAISYILVISAPTLLQLLINFCSIN